MVMYLRFVVPHIDEDSERMVGVFHALWDLRVRGLLYPYEEEQHDALRHWFSWWLKRPTRFTVAKPPYWRKKNKAICWFRDSAETHIWQVWGMVAILQDHGVSVKMLKAKRVGYVVYEDDTRSQQCRLLRRGADAVVETKQRAERRSSTLRPLPLLLVARIAANDAAAIGSDIHASKGARISG